MKRLASILICLIMQGSAFAQNLPDSLYIYHQDLKRTAFAYRGLTQLIGSGIGQTSRVGLSYQSEQGHYRRSQQAETESNAMVFTEGIRSIGKFRFAGHFSFGRDWQDSLKWSTRLKEDDMTPYYYGAIKAGKFEKLAYDLGGLVAYQVSDKLHIGTGISYEYRSSARSVDPRASITLFDLEVRPELVFTAGRNMFGLRGTYGYATENTSITYKNRDFMVSLGYPDRINYYLRGYGFLDRTRHGAQSGIKTSRNGGAAISHGWRSGRSHLQTILSFDHLLEQNGKELVNSSRDTNSSEFVVDRYELRLLYTYGADRYDHQLELSAGMTDAFDRDLILLGSNYFYTRNELDADYSIRLTANADTRTGKEFGIGLNYEEVNRRDQSSAHVGSYSILEPRMYSNLYLQGNESNRFLIGLGASYRHPLNNDLTVPVSQQTVFTTDVIYPDQDYHASKAFTGRGQLSWFNTSLLKQFTLGAKAGATYTARLDQPQPWDNYSFVADKNRLTINFAVNLYF